MAGNDAGRRPRSAFFAYLGRLRWIRRWGLMRNAIEEDVATHSWEVGVLAHALATIRNVHFEGQVDADGIAAAALYHDASEVITGDMPTPVKYYSSVMREAFADVEHKAQQELLALLPDPLSRALSPYVEEEQWSEEARVIIKAADRLAALLKCEAELRAGNGEFEQAAAQIRQRLEADSLPEVAYFLEVFAPDYGASLDYLLKRQ